MDTPESISSLPDPKNVASKIDNEDHGAIRTLIEKQGSGNAHLTHVPVSWRGLGVSAPDTGRVTVKTLPRACLNTFGIDQFNFVKKLLFPKGFGESKHRSLLEDFTGIVKPGEMLLVLGRPGSGCSTFLRTLANRTSLETNGDRQYAGIPSDEFGKNHRRDTIYLPEEDQHIAALTVRQTLRFALRMSLPSEVRNGPMVEELVKSMAQMFGIDHALDTPVGGSFFPGVSGGERKRVSIAEVLAAGSSVQCFDNSTRGLDSSTALDFVKAIHVLTKVGDRTTMATLYQAGETLYNYFDKVLVIYEGRQAFFGKIGDARQYFEDLGFVRVQGQTTAEFLSHVTDPSHREFIPGSVAANMHTAADFAAAFKSSSHHANLIREIDDSLSQSQDHPQAAISKRTASSSFNLAFPLQLWECLLREVQLARGQSIIYFGKWIATIILCLVIGSEYFDVSTDAQGAFTRGGLLFFALIMNGWLQFPELFDAHTNRPVLERQAALHMYRPSAVALARAIIDVPLIIFQNLIFVIVFYFLAGLQMEAGKFFFFWFVLILSTLCFSNVLRMFAYYVPTLDDCFRFGGTGSTITILFSGFLVPTKDMRPYFGWFHYLSPINYAYESVFVNEFNGLNLDCSGSMIPNVPGADPDYQICMVTGAKEGQQTIPGLQYAEANGLYLAHKWRNVGILFAFIVAYVIISMIGSELMQFTPQGGSPIVFIKSKKGQAQSGTDGTIEKDVERELPTSGVDEPKSGAARHSGPSLTWKRLTIDIGERRIIKGVSAFLRPGDFVSICGASGAGKTTMLKALSQINVTGEVGGELLFGNAAPGQSFGKVTGFAQQADLHDPMATVREALEFAALLRQPDIYSRAEKLAYVDTVLDLLDLRHIADGLIGDENSGLGVEMKKRVTIGVELAARPRVLFADEPTSGLDSEGAANIVRYLRKLSHTGQAVLVTIHQPSALVFSEFDKLLALSPEGEELYFGPNDKALAYFTRHGATPALDVNPAEFILEAGGAGINARNNTKGSEWAKHWRDSPEAKAVEEDIDRINKDYQEGDNGFEEEIGRGEFNASILVQSWLLTIRMLKNQWRNPPYIYSKIWVHVVHAILIGTTVYKLGTSPSDLQNRMLSVFSIVLLVNTIVNTILARFFFVRLLWETREGPSHTYGWQALCTASIAAEMPGALVCTVLYYVIWYWLCGLPSGESAGYVFLALLTFEVFEILFGLFMIGMSADLGTAGNVLVFLVCSVNWFNGIIVPYEQIQVFWRYWLYWLNPFTYLLGGLVTAVIQDQPVVCKEGDLLSLSPPANQTCDSYLSSWASSAQVQILNPSATENCQLCEYTTGNQYLAGFQLGGGQNGGIWGNWGIFVLFTVSSFFLVYFTTWALKVHKWKKAPAVAKKESAEPAASGYRTLNSNNWLAPSFTAASGIMTRTDERQPLLESQRNMATPDNSTIPDGGFKAWSQVVGAFFLMFNCWGIVNCYGGFQAYYMTVLFPDASPASISWIGSLQAFLLIFISVLTGPAYDAGYFQALIVTGTVLMAFGTLMVSFCSQYWQLLLAQSLCTGLGAGCLFVPGVAILSTYFKKHSSLAIGIATSGGSIGGIVYSALFKRAELSLGFARSVRILALVMLLTQSISLLTMRVRMVPATRRAYLQLSAFRELPYALYSGGVLFAFMGMYIPFFFIQNYAIEHGLLRPDQASYTLMTLNLASLFGRIIPNMLADRTGPFNMLIPCSFITSVLAFSWIWMDSVGALFVFCTLYGFFSGAFVSLSPTTVVSLSPNLGVVGVRMGMSFVFAATGLLTGTPSAGAILKAAGWPALQAFCGGCVGLAMIGMVAARVAKAGPSLRVLV
ncbi:hypothetical protein P280DRAFT_519746 [Massarina eburnea CBS 473.64]|uniref:ABC transporter n=1 Tax=Massarina eburnea CBS 473.64 TaxID=1395130 RepID=A0A6A6RV52_9PLEO|nr:hypothetical protein P280DRAFT_519746 [Massarina eburnea CBS 473.64]